MIFEDRIGFRFTYFYRIGVVGAESGYGGWVQVLK